LLSLHVAQFINIPDNNCATTCNNIVIKSYRDRQTDCYCLTLINSAMSRDTVVSRDEFTILLYICIASRDRIVYLYANWWVASIHDYRISI